MRQQAPQNHDFKCDKCGLELPRGEGSYLYVENINGKRIECRKGEEPETVREVLGRNVSWSEMKESMGRNWHCICLDCTCQFDADYGFCGYQVPSGLSVLKKFWLEFSKGWMPDKDKRACPRCGSSNVRTIREIIGHTCPKCKEGTMRAIPIAPKESKGKKKK